MHSASSVWPPTSQLRRKSNTRKSRFLPRDAGTRAISSPANGMIATRLAARGAGPDVTAADARAKLCLSRRLEDLGDDRVGPHALGLALEVHDHAVAQRRGGDVADVIDRHRVAALEQRADLGREDHR